MVGDFHALDKFGDLVFGDDKGNVPPRAMPTVAGRLAPMTGAGAVGKEAAKEPAKKDSAKKEAAKLSPQAAAQAHNLPEKFEWSYEYTVPSAGVPLTDSLVLVLRDADNRIVARVAARL